MKKFVYHISIIFTVAIFLWNFSMVSFADKSQTPPKIGLILATGGLGDRSFNDQSYWGASEAAKEIATERKAKVEDVLNYVEPTSIAEYEGFQAAEENKKRWAIGTDVDQAWSMPEHADIIIASGLKRVDLAVKNEIQKTIKGTWKSGIIQYGVNTEIGIGTGIAIGNQDVNEYIRASKSKRNTDLRSKDVEVKIPLEDCLENLLDCL